MSTGRLLRVVKDFSFLVAQDLDEPTILERGRESLAELVAHDDWLPEFASAPSQERYRQYLLYGDPLERFSIVSFVWGPGQQTPVHNHTIWGLVGILRGEEKARSFTPGHDGRLIASEWQTLHPGEIEAVSPNVGDIHQVANALLDRPSISIHIYGANIGSVSRSTFDVDTGTQKEFVSGYDNAYVPNLWCK